MPIKEIEEALNGEKIPALKSESAGSFVCNHVFYKLMQYLQNQKQNPHLISGFIHVPCLPIQRSDNNMPLVTITEGLRVIIKVLLSERERE